MSRYESNIGIIGANSMLGLAVGESAKKRGVEAFGTVRTEMENPLGIDLYHLDITDYDAVKKVIEKTHRGCKALFLAAAVTNPREAKKMKNVDSINVVGVENFFRAYLELKIPQTYWPKFILFGSALQYKVEKEGPISEDNPVIETDDPYAKSKNALDVLQSQYTDLGFDITKAVIFRTSGEHQRDTDFFVSKAAMKLARMKHLGEEKILTTWNVDGSLDYQDASKAGEQLLLSLGTDRNEKINICSGRATSLRFIVESLIEVSGLKKVKHAVDPEHNDPPKFKAVWGDDKKIVGLGSKQEDTIREMCRKAFLGREKQLLEMIDKGTVPQKFE